MALYTVASSARIKGMNGERAERELFNWRLPFCVVAGASLVLLSLFLYSPDGDLLYILLIAPIFCVVCLVLLVTSAIRKKPRRSLETLLTLMIFLLLSAALLKNEAAVRPWLRWFLLSHHFKAQVLAQPTPINEELKHVEWDGWGGAPVGDWTAYVVFDPTDSLSAPAKSNSSGKLKGIPCSVDVVHRLESHWYSVTLSMNEWWDRCGEDSQSRTPMGLVVN